MLRVLLWIAAGIAALIAVLFLPLSWPDAWVGSHVVNRIEIAAPPERVFSYVTTPANWPRCCKRWRTRTWRKAGLAWPR